MIKRHELLSYFSKFHSVEIIECESLHLIQITQKVTKETIFIQFQPLYCKFQLYLWFMAYKDFYRTLNWKVCYYTFLQFTEMQRLTNTKTNNK